MLTKAEESYKNLITGYLKTDEGMNTPVLANIERFGLTKEFQDVWLYHTDYSEPKAVVMRHFNHMYLYVMSTDTDYEEIASFSSFFGTDTIWSSLKCIETLTPYLPEYKLEPSKYMILANRDKLAACSGVEFAVPEDSRELAEMIFAEEDFKRFYTGVHEIELGIRRRIEMGQCRYTVIRGPGGIVSQAYSTIETENFATVGGVVTRPEERGKGYAGQVVSALCHEIFNRGRKPNLFYKTAEAGKVYKRLGFIDEGDYGMLYI